MTDTKTETKTTNWSVGAGFFKIGQERSVSTTREIGPSNSGKSPRPRGERFRADDERLKKLIWAAKRERGLAIARGDYQGKFRADLKIKDLSEKRKKLWLGDAKRRLSRE